MAKSVDPLLFEELHPARYGSGRRKGPLILPRLLDAHAQGPNGRDDAAAAAHAIFLTWAELEEKGKLQGMNESQLKGDFLNHIFGEALGYRRLSESNGAFNLFPEYPLNGDKADAALGVFQPDRSGELRALVEIKGPTVNVDRDRSAGRTPVEQLWDYLNRAPHCPWGILCNHVSFRLYHRNKTPSFFERYTLQELRKPEAFKRFFFLFGRDGILGSRIARPWADRLLEDTDNRQREVGDELYARYSEHRLGLIHELTTKHKRPIDAAIRVAQKLLDRIIFIAFCEDRGLIQPKSIRAAWEEKSKFDRKKNPRWNSFRDLFTAMDVGHSELGVEAGYNGGLFRHDPDLDELQLDDTWTTFFKEVGDYDFRDEVNVEVLGHLFEQSITELEKLRSAGLLDIPLKKTPPRAEMPKSAQRKRFGVFYTPPKFTELIVQHAVGAVIDERFAAIASASGAGTIDEAAAAKPKEFWRKCLQALREIKVCDPACGSGAFLIRAFDYLEERYLDLLDELAKAGDRAADRERVLVSGWILSDNLFGVDLSEEAVEISQLALWIRTAKLNRKLDDLSANIVCGNSLVEDRSVDPRALNWREAFPSVFNRQGAGFDCVVGNPPWERVKLQEREFFSLSDPKIAAAVNAADRRRAIEKLAGAHPELHARYLDAKARAERMLDYSRASGAYPLTGKGDINTYMLFAERARSLVAPTGRVGLLVPSGIATDDTTKVFFNELIDSESLVLLYDFENKKPYFPDVHRSFKFSAMVFTGPSLKSGITDFVFFAREVEELRDPKRHIKLTPADFRLLNPNTRTCPIFRSQRDAELTKRVYKRVPILVDKTRKSGGNAWGVRFLRMFDQTNDAELFLTTPKLKDMGFKRGGNVWRKRKTAILPLYEAKMVQAYDHRAASVVIDEDNWMRQGQTVATSLVSHQNPEFNLEPRWWVEEGAVIERLGGHPYKWLLGFKDITSPTNERTMIAAFIPIAGVTNHFPLLLTEHSPRLQLCLAANLNSFVLDYVARQKIGGVTLNFFIVEQFPILPPDAYGDRCPWNKRQSRERWISDRVLKLTCTANDMIPLAEESKCEAQVYKWKPAERAQLRAELDAAYFLLYGLTRNEAEYVLSTFSVAIEPEPDVPGAPRIADLVMQCYDKLSGE